MISLMQMIENGREAQILKTAFEQRGLKVILSAASYQSFVLCLQYLPDIILMEIPRICSEQQHFSTLIRKHKRTKATPIIGYGDRVDEMVKRGLFNCGVTQYLERPLKYSFLVQQFEKLLKTQNKKIEEPELSTDKEKDVELILDAHTPPMAKIEAMTRHISTLMAFPFTIAKVLKITQDEKSGAGHLAQAINADPTISAHLLRLSNSVFFASANRRINSIKDAIVRIGFLQTKKIVMSMSVMKLFGKRNKCLGFDRIDFWYHSLAAGLIAEHTSRHMGGVNAEEAFLAGLLHDIGVLMLDEFFPTIFDLVLEDTARKGDHFPDRTMAMLGINTNDLVGSLFPQWKLPQTLTEAVTNQFKVEQLRDKLDTHGNRLALCVSVGNTLAKALHIGRECDEYVFPIANWAFDALRMRTGFTSSFIEDVTRDVDQFRRFLQLDERDYQNGSGLENPESLRIGILNAAHDLFAPPLEHFTNQRLTIETIAANNPASACNGKFSIIVVWAGPETTAATIEPYTRIIKHCEQIPQVGAQLDLAPVLAIVPPQHELTSSDTGKMSVMVNQFDLRVLDKNSTEVMMGKVLRPDAVVPKKEPSAADPAGLMQ